MSRPKSKSLRIGSRRRNRSTGAAIALLFLIAFCVSSSRTQESLSGQTGLMVTLREFQIGRIGSFSTCINVWEDGRFHLERRSQLLPSPKADLVVYEATLPEAQLLALKHLLESDQLRSLPPMESIERYSGKTWMSGFEAKIIRQPSIQDVGYFEFGLYDPAKHSESIGLSDPQQKAVTEPLQKWLQQVNSRNLSLPGGGPTMCEILPVRE